MPQPQKRPQRAFDGASWAEPRRAAAIDQRDDFEHDWTDAHRHPQTNGKVERFNGRVTELIAQTRFKSAQELEQTLLNYVRTYNHRIPQRALDHQTPIQALKDWRLKSPDLFKKRVHDLPGLDR